MYTPLFLGKHFSTLRLANDFVYLKINNSNLVYPFEISEYVDAMVAILQGKYTKAMPNDEMELVDNLITTILDRCEKIHFEYRVTMETWLRENTVVRCKLPWGIPDATKAELGKIVYCVFFDLLDLREVRNELEG
ncbi:hypothetical protein DOM22_05300 [Bdellovibrio sp. ZAP7]|uniref:hypothetical protein n=1 Tax=Bdellovibrio sp. ZAP7 TaxID=2231053 RepID=UPI00115B02E7|nr:hypothetical protein [Bdellovibrio sp. ZAP7]QDK44617.1 hypothetical protein DOM22_05300 [Bdellovibrio sp. ZAP7]